MMEELKSLRKKVTDLEQMILRVNKQLRMVMQAFLQHRTSQVDGLQRLFQEERDLCGSLMDQIAKHVKSVGDEDEESVVVIHQAKKRRRGNAAIAGTFRPQSPSPTSPDCETMSDDEDVIVKIEPDDDNEQDGMILESIDYSSSSLHCDDSESKRKRFKNSIIRAIGKPDGTGTPDNYRHAKQALSSQIGRLPTILDGKFFTVVNVIGNNKVQAECKVCSKRKIINGYKSPSSNFSRHLKIVHPSAFIEYEKHKDKTMGTRSRHKQFRNMTSN